MKNILITLIFISFLMAWGSGDYTLDAIVMQRFAIILIMFSVLLCFQIPLSAIPIVIISLVSGITTTMWFSIYSYLPFEIQAPLRHHSGMGTLYLIMSIIFIKSISADLIKSALQSFGIAGVFTAIMILFKNNLGQIPIFDNLSMGASFAAITVFLLPKQIFKYLFPIVATAVLYSKASTPIMCLGVGFITKYRSNKWVWLSISLVPLFFFFKATT